MEKSTNMDCIKKYFTFLSSYRILLLNFLNINLMKIVGFSIGEYLIIACTIQIHSYKAKVKLQLFGSSPRFNNIMIMYFQKNIFKEGKIKAR